MEHSDAIQNYVNERLERVEKLLKKEHDPINLDIILEAGRTHHHHRVEILLHTPNFNLAAHDEGPELYPVVHKAIDRLFAEVTKAKEKKVDARKKGDQHRVI